MKILVYCEYALNYGDLSFAKKTADALKARYPEADITVITSPIPKLASRREDLMKHVEKINEQAVVMPITYLDRYKSEVDVNDDAHIDLLVVGPVLNFSPAQIDFLTNHDHQVPIMVMGEYDFGEDDVQSFKYVLEERGYTHIVGVPTGLNSEMGSKGIYLSEDILSVDKSNLIEKKRIFETELVRTRDILLNGRTTDTYVMDTDVAVNYSHNNAKRVIAVHSLYVDPADEKNVDLIILGEEEKKDLLVLRERAPLLLDKGFSRVVYQDVGEDPIVLAETLNGGPTYRVIHTGPVGPKESIALRKIGGHFSGATGDQSLSEALSGSHIVVYETEYHKLQVANGLENIADEVDSTGVLRQVIYLLNHAETEEEFSTLATALKEPPVRMMLEHYHQAIEDKNLYRVLPVMVDELEQKISFAMAKSRLQQQKARFTYRLLRKSLGGFMSGMSSVFKNQYQSLIGSRGVAELGKHRHSASHLTETSSEHSADSDEPKTPRSSR